MTIHNFSEIFSSLEVIIDSAKITYVTPKSKRDFEAILKNKIWADRELIEIEKMLKIVIDDLFGEWDIL